MRSFVKTIMDLLAAAFVYVAALPLKFVAKHRQSLPRYQAACDQLGFQVRSNHYYEPTYSEADLPKNTDFERELPGLDLREAAQLAWLERFTFADELRAIPDTPSTDTGFGYRNNMYSYGDAEALYSIIRLEKPRRLIEVGSGHSTLCARLAIDANMRDDSGYTCEHICIEPFEVPWLERSPVRVIRERVQDVDLALFDTLQAGDIFFIDSSHVIRPHGDVLCEFLNIVPRLASGVHIAVDDIFTPRDYPERWLRADRRLWNEQYLLEAFLAFNSSFEVTLAVNWLKHNHLPEMQRAFPMMLANPWKNPGAFWFRRK